MRLWRRRAPGVESKIFAYRCIYTERRRRHVRNSIHNRIDRQRLAGHRIPRLCNGGEPKRAPDGRRRSRRLVCAGACDRRRRRARSHPRAWRSRSRPHGRAAGRSARLRLFRVRADSGRDAGYAFAGAGRGQHDPNPRRDLRHSLRGGEASRAIRSKRRLGRRDHRRRRAPLAWSIAQFGARVRLLALMWNIFGVVDLVNAIALGALSAPGPLNAFVGPPTSAIMTSLPWLMIPGFLVPILFFTHVVIFYRLLAKTEGATRAWADEHRTRAA